MGWPVADLGIILVERPASAQKLTLIGRHFEFIEDGVHWADRLAVGAVDARSGVDVIHLFFIRGCDATYRTHFQTGRVLNPDAGFRDNESQNFLVIPETARCDRGAPRRFIELMKGGGRSFRMPPDLPDYTGPGVRPERSFAPNRLMNCPVMSAVGRGRPRITQPGRCLPLASIRARRNFVR